MHLPLTNHPTARRILHALVLLCLGLCAVASVTAYTTPNWVNVAHAQEQAPMRLTLINVAPGDGDRAYNTLYGILDANESLKMTEGELIRAEMDDFAVNDKILKKGSLRKKFRNRIARMMRAKNIEGMLILDVFSKRRKLQIIVIGPNGNELFELRRNIKRGRLKKSVAIGILKDVFPTLGPEVLAYREKQSQTSNTPPDDPPEDPPDNPKKPAKKPSTRVNKKTETSEPEVSVGQFKRQIALGVGMFVGQRTMDVREDQQGEPDSIGHSTPFLGVGIQADLIVSVLGEQKDAAIGIRAFGGYSPFKTVFRTRSEQAPEEFDSAIARIGAQLAYKKYLSSSFMASFFGGAEVFNLTIARNDNYTGNQYVMGRLGAELGYSFFDAGGLIQGHAGILPVFSASNSGTALGNSPVSLGFEVGARAGFNITDTFYINADYSFQYLQPEYPEPDGSSEIDTAATSSDLIHTSFINIGMIF